MLVVFFFYFGFGGEVEGQSGTYAGIATAGNPERSSRHGNAHGGNAGDSEFSSCDGGPGSNVYRNTSETSFVQGSCGLGGGVGGQSGPHAGIATIESLEGSSRIHNECNQNTSSSEFLSHESGLGSGTGRNMQEASSAQGSLDVHILSGPFGGSIGGASAQEPATIIKEMNMQASKIFALCHSHMIIWNSIETKWSKLVAVALKV